MNHCVYISFSKKVNSYYTRLNSNLGNKLNWHNAENSKKHTLKLLVKGHIFFVIKVNSSIQARKIKKHSKAMKTKV